MNTITTLRTAAAALLPSLLFPLPFPLLFPLLLSLLLALQPVHAAEGDALSTLQTQADAQVRAGYDQPDAALAALSALSKSPAAAGAGVSAQRVLLLARGLVNASVGRSADVAAVRSALGHLSGTQGQALAAADGLLVQAMLDFNTGQVAAAGVAATSALQLYDQHCPALDGCDWRSRWHTQLLLARQGSSSGHLHPARDHALAAAEAARAAGDLGRQVWALATVAHLSAALGDSNAEERHMARAQRLARLEASPGLQARMKIFETRLWQAHGDSDGARRAAERGLVLARDARSPRMEAILLANLSDILVKSQHPQPALHAVEQALPIARRVGDRRIEQVLLHNAALARIALGQSDGARRTLDELLRAHSGSGAAGDQVVVLREFAAAFAGAGDHVTALSLYHRERALAAEIMAANRQAALAALQARFDREAQQRRLEQLGRDNALMSTQIDNRSIMRKVWFGSAIALLLAGAVVALLYRRVREINRRLTHNQAFLRAQSERDPLTGLANRRALHSLALAQGDDQRFAGALLLVDIDHFKHVNDGHGHAQGDLVLVEVARRLATAVGAKDLLVRWGGEEFLVYLPGATLAQAEALAERLLHAVGQTPVALAAGPLRVTASVGYGAFPLPPQLLPLHLERAINLTDMALYTAKNQGRNRAIGIASIAAADAEELVRVEADFDLAWQEGRITLLRSAGPGAPGAPPGAATADAGPITVPAAMPGLLGGHPPARPVDSRWSTIDA